MSIYHHIPEAYMEYILYFGVALALTYFISGLDDAFIDLVAFVKKLGPKELSHANLTSLIHLPEKKIAIMVPAWHEGNIIEKMLHGNLSQLQYSNFHIFVGVYPNDMDTVNAVERVSKIFPHVHAVVNHKAGPTSKGQMLNHVVETILTFEHQAGVRFDGFLMQDAEDLFHPLILKLVNHELNSNDFVQTPVFSLELKTSQLVAGTYIDEFAEFHTKDILVREKLGAAVPSAGVGTALSRDLVLGLREVQNGTVYNEGSLTEDYELGVRSHALGFKPHFSCYFFKLENGKKEFIATREYFPKKFIRSVRQKTRWTIGISLQGWRNLGWQGGFVDRYFLFRDRKGILTNLASLAGYPFILFCLATPNEIWSSQFNSPILETLLSIAFIGNLAFLSLRLFQKFNCVRRVYGYQCALGIPLRWPVGIAINAFAVLRAVKTDLQSMITRTKIAWAKTEHELPAYFGNVSTTAKGAS